MPANEDWIPTDGKAKVRANLEAIALLNNCMACHALGTKGTRELPESLRNFDSSVKAWERRLMSGQAGGNMISTLVQIGRERTLKMFADWTDRIAAGELPPAPRRPQGIERNVVITQWDWAHPKAYLHDTRSWRAKTATMKQTQRIGSKRYPLSIACPILSAALKANWTRPIFANFLSVAGSVSRAAISADPSVSCCG